MSNTSRSQLHQKVKYEFIASGPNDKVLRGEGIVVREVAKRSPYSNRPGIQRFLTIEIAGGKRVRTWSWNTMEVA